MLHRSHVIATFCLYLFIQSHNIGNLVSSQGSRVLNLGENLPDLVKQGTNRNWLIKFYAPWCYACQRLEPIYHRVAEKIYHNHDHLLVGRVDCTKYNNVCQHYDVQSYPTILFINRDSRYEFSSSERSVELIVNFAERLHGPDVKELNDCVIDKLSNNHNQIVVSSFKNTSNEVHLAFKKVAKQMKTDFCFFHLNSICNDTLDEENLYLVKKYIDQPLKFEYSDDATTDELAEYFKQWLDLESFPIYGQIHRLNYEKLLDLNRTLVLAIIEKYEQARQFTIPSAKFYKQFEGLVPTLVQSHPQYTYAWTSDLELIYRIIIGQIPTPNLMILKPDKSFHYMMENATTENESINKVPSSLSDEFIIELIRKAGKGRLNFFGGNDIYTEFKRFIFTKYIQFHRLVLANPLLTSILVLLPTVGVSLIIYITCFTDGVFFDEQDINDDEENEHLEHNFEANGEHIRASRNHVKQD